MLRVFTPMAVAMAAALLLTACNQPAVPTVETPRPVKVEVVGDATLETRETFIGTLRARQRATLGFESPGRVAAVLVDVGDRVRAGQVLAQLEDAPARWRLDKVEADRAAAASALAERSTQLQQHELLARDGIVSAATLESVQVQHRQALSQLQAAEAALAMARRDLSMVSIKAPFDGDVVSRSVQPYTDVGPGQPVLQIEAGRSLEVAVMLPDAVAERLSPGDLASASQGQRTMPIKLERISARSENGSLVQATFRLDRITDELRSGGVVTVELPRVGAKTLSVPVAAVVYADKGQGNASVFVLDPTRQQLVRRAVVLGDSVLPHGRVAVVSGLAQGEAVVVAGTAFLTDGQRAVKQDAQTLLAGGRS